MLCGCEFVTHTPHSVPSSCTLCQPVLMVSTSDKKYRFGVPFELHTEQVGLHTRLNVPFEVLTKQVRLYVYCVCMYHTWLHMCATVYILTWC